MKFKRVISTILVMCMLLTVFPAAVFAEQEEENGATVWETNRIGELTTEEMGEGVIYAGSPGGNADEKGQYVLSLFRDGYCDEEATVELHTVDVSAKIGVDYQIIGEDTTYTELDGTVMERNANYDAEKSVQQFNDEMIEIQQSLDDAGEGDVQEEAVVKEKSSLAQIKEEQTGIKTRDIIEKDEKQTTNLAESVVQMVTPEQEEISGMLNEYAADNLGEFMESSSVSLITFEPGETEKQITIEVYEDEEAEADEIAYLFLSGANGALLGDLNSATMNIIDDEEDEDIFVSLSDEYYRFDEGEDNIVLVRTGAVYEMVSADVRLEDGSVQTVMFKPYETEKQIPLTVSGSGVVDVTLENFKGCMEGDITKASVIFGEDTEIKLLSDASEEYESKPDISLMADIRSDKVSFILPTIKGHNGYDLRVDYVPDQEDEYGNLYGKIYDTGRIPEVHVGNYFFPSNFSYNYTGYGDPSERKAEHRYNTSNPDNEPGGYAYLHWYDWRTWKNGTSYARLSNVNHRLYQYYAIDWHQSRDKYGGQNSRFKVFKNGGYSSVSDEPTISQGGSFDRKLTSHTALGKDELPQDAGGYLEAHAQDDNGNKTPVVTLYVYGIAAFFREFDISINQPAKMEFVGSGNVKETNVPVNVSLGDGHSLRYTEQSLAVKQNSAYQNGIIAGELIGYKIETNPNASDASKKKTFYYMAHGKTPSMAVGNYSGAYYNAEKGANMESIYFGNDFITNKIDKNLAGVSGSGTDWSTALSFTPLYQYKDTTVQIISNSGGSINEFNPGTYYSYNIGDTLTFNGKPNNEEEYIFAGCHVVGRATSNMNETPLIDETLWANNGSQITLQLGEKNCTHYQIEPVFKQKLNYITINDATNGTVAISNLLTADEISTLKRAYPYYGFDENQKIYVANPTGKDSSKAESILDAITVNPGEIYQIQAEGKTSDDGYYKPTFYNKYFSSYKVTSRIYDYVASGNLSENVITVGAEKRTQSEETYIELNGAIQSTEYSIRQTAATMESTGVSNLSVKAGDRGFVNLWVTMNNTTQKLSQLERATCITDENGGFTLSGIQGKTTDAITMYYSNGDIEGVRVINLADLTGDGVVSDGEIEYKTAVANDDKTNSEEIKKVNGKIYYLSKSDKSYYSKITTPVFTKSAPYPVSVDYTYLSGSNIEQFGTSGNSIAIMDDKLTLTLKVNRNGHQLSKVVFTIDKQRSADVEYEIAGKVNQDIYTCDFDGKMMKDIFEAGDRIYVTLYDAELRKISYTSTDENGNEIIVTADEEIVYNKIFTGLSFYVPMLEVVPQVFEIPESIGTEVPILGDVMGKASSGVVSFSVQTWETEDKVEGMSLVLDANINAWNKNGATSPAQDLLKKVKEQGNNASEEAARDYDSNPFYEEKDYDKLYDSTYKKSLNDMLGSSIIKVNVIVLLNFDFAYSESEGRYLYTGGQVVFGGSFNIRRTFYWVVYGVPLYLQLAGDFAVQLQANYGVDEKTLDYDKFKEYENIFDAVDSTNSDVGMFFNLGGKLSVGVGICGVLGAKGVVDVDIRIFVSFMHEANSGIIGGIRGGFGVDLVIFSLEYTVGYQIGCGIYEDESGWLTSVDEENVKLDNIRTYSAGDGSQVGAGTVQENGYEVLLDNAAERTKPQVVTLNDGRKLLVYIGSSPDRELNINKHCLYYSVYEDGHWQEARVIEADGTADGTPTVAQYGDKVIVAWADATREFTADEIENGKYKEIIADFDISASIFDPETSSFGEILRVSDDAENYDGARYLDYAPVISADKNGEHGAAVFYIKREILEANSDNELIDNTAVYETIALTVVNNDSEVIAEQYMAVEDDPLMFHLDSAMEVLEVNGEKHAFAICTYATDRDNDLSNDSDWDVYLLLHDITANKTYEPINLCNDFVADRTPRLTRINDSVYLTYITHKEDSVSDAMINVLNYMSVTDMLDIMQHGTQAEDGTREWNIDMSDILYDENSEDDIPWYHKTAEQLGLTAEQYEESIFAELYENNFPITQVDMKIDDNQTASVGSYQIAEGKDGKMYLLWIDSGSTEPDDYSIELYGAVNNVNAEEGERSGWSKPVKLTGFSEYVKNSVIDEFSVAVDENGEFTLVSNMYTQNLVDGKVEYSPNKLIAFTLDESGELIFGDSGVSFEKRYPKAGEETEVTFAVKNDGLQAINVSQAIITVDGCQDVMVDINETLFGGESKDVSTTVKMPEGIDDTTSITVTVETEEGQIAAMNNPVPYGASLGFDTKNIILNEDGTYSYIVEITNYGNKASGEFNIDAQRVVSGEGLVGKVSQTAAESIEAGETAEHTIKLGTGTLSAENFSDLGIVQLSLRANQSGTELSGDIKRISSKMVKSAEEVTEEDDGKDEEDNKTTSTDRKPVSGIGSGGVSAGNSTETTTPELIMPFTDVKTGDWYYDSVKYVYDNGIFKGTSDTTFEPDSPITRGMFVTVLGRYEGIEEAEVSDMPFADVKADEYYAAHIKWAAENGIVNGYGDDNFGPDDVITREQMAAIMYRYSGYKGEDLSVGENTNILSYEDYAEISEYAIPAMQYAVGSGLMKGKSDSELDPQGILTRAEMATVMMRYSL